jgi:hypothetical protein
MNLHDISQNFNMNRPQTSVLPEHALSASAPLLGGNIHSSYFSPMHQSTFHPSSGSVHSPQYTTPNGATQVPGGMYTNPSTASYQHPSNGGHPQAHIFANITMPGINAMQMANLMPRHSMTSSTIIPDSFHHQPFAEHSFVNHSGHNAYQGSGARHSMLMQGTGYIEENHHSISTSGTAEISSHNHHSLSPHATAADTVINSSGTMQPKANKNKRAAKSKSNIFEYYMDKFELCAGIEENPLEWDLPPTLTAVGWYMRLNGIVIKKLPLPNERDIQVL